MCFSLEASFITSGALFLIGALTVKKLKDIKTHSNKFLLFALIPIFFAIQQLFEGFNWYLTLYHHNQELLELVSYAFLFFALIFWPVYIPFSLLFIEEQDNRKKLITTSLIIGLLVSIFNIYSLVRYGASSTIIASHIKYDFVRETQCDYLNIFIYCLATISPFFISSFKLINFFGILLTLSVFFSYIAYTQFFTSIWCFFAAVLSVFVYLIVPKKNKK